MEKKKIMILGAGRGQVRLIEAAKRLGYHTIVAGIAGNYPGLKVADEVCSVDISSPEAVLAAAREKQIGGIATCCLDTGIASLGYVCDQLGLTGLSAEAARCSGDKLLMKTALEAHGVQTARFRVIRAPEDLDKAFSELTFPLIIKAVDLQGSRGIYICRDRESVRQGFYRIREESKKDFCLLEEFIEGNEFGAQAMVIDGELLYILPASDETFLGNTNIPVGHSVPYVCPPEAERKIAALVTDAIAAVGLDNCAVNLDLIEKNGEYYVIELTGRIGANCLPELVSLYYDVPIYEMIALLAMGEKERVRTLFAEAEHSGPAAVAKMLFLQESGTVQSIAYKGEADGSVCEVTFFVGENDEVRKFTNSRDCIGQAVVRGRTLAECAAAMERVLASTEIILK